MAALGHQRLKAATQRSIDAKPIDWSIECQKMLWGRRRGCGTIVAVWQPMERPMKRDDLSRSLVAFDQASGLVAVVAAGLIPHLSRQPLKKPRSDPDVLPGLLWRGRDQASKAGGRIKRIVVAFEAGRDGFWLARRLRVRGIEAYVIHPASIPVSREHRRGKTDRLDTGLLMRAVLGWLRGEPKHCNMPAIPTVSEEDARRPTRERETLIREQTRAVNRIRSTLIRFGIRRVRPREPSPAIRSVYHRYCTELVERDIADSSRVPERQHSRGWDFPRMCVGGA
jgi:transposase